MKTAISILTVLAAIPGAFAATHAVLPGGSIQEKIDLAQPGDIVAVFGGTYPGDVTINKSIRLVEVDGQDVTITGNVTWNNVNNAPPFEGFTVGSPGKGISVNSTTGFLIKNVDASAGTGVRVTGTSRVGVIGGLFSKIYQDGGELSTIRSQINGDFETTLNSLKTVSFRTTVTASMIWKSKKAWCGYSSAQYLKFSGLNSDLVVIGCTIDVRGYWYSGSHDLAYSQNSGYFESYAIDIRGSGNNISISNCQIRRVTAIVIRNGNQPHPFAYTVARGIFIEGDQRTFISNNYIEMMINQFTNGSHTDVYGIRAFGAPNSKIYNNIITGGLYGIDAPFGADVRNNCISAVATSTNVGGHVPTGQLNTNPLFVTDQIPALQPTSPCINAGVNDPIFNDLDGSRNDIGPSGGCLFDPQGWTTNNPVVISFDLAPLQLLKGVDTQVTLSKGQAVSQP